MTHQLPHVVIVGGGFAGLAAAKALRKTSAKVILIDRTNHYLFQPLLYQVATSELTAGQIATPIRNILRNQKNTTVIMGEVTAVDKDRNCVISSDADWQNVSIAYDYLILATGASHSYFGHNEFAEYAPGLKSLAGAGPTGVEMAAALAIFVRNTLKSDFRRIDPASARIVLVDMASRVLPPYSESLSKAAKQRLEKLGVEVRLGHSVDLIDAEGVVIAGERIASKTVTWTAGVAPSPAGKWLNAETDRAGRVRIQKDLTVPGHPEIFVVGDTASLDQNGKPLPGLAQVAMQQGRYAAKLIHNRIVGNPPLSPFNYFDKGSMAEVGKGFAVLQSGKIRISGFVAWLAWVAVHVQFLATSSLRLSVFLQWKWTSLTGQRGDRLIVSQHASEAAKPGLDATVKATFVGRLNSGPGRTEGVKTPTGGAIA